MGVIDIIGVPAAIFFVLVVRALQRGTFRDWNEISRRLGGDGDGSATGPGGSPPTPRPRVAVVTRP